MVGLDESPKELTWNTATSW